MRFLHCSDVHITQNYGEAQLRRLGWRRWIALVELQLGGRARRFRDADVTLRQIARDAEALGVEHLIVSGDLTAYSMPSEFQGARACLQPWAEDPRRCSVIPGNHDRYTPGSLSTHRFEQSFGQLTRSDLPEYVAEDDFPFVRLLGERDAVVGLCSARVPRFPGMSFGVIGPRQLGALEGLLRDPRMQDRAVLVLVHHAPFLADGRPDTPSHGLHDRQALLRLLPGPRFAVLHGHVHHRYHHPATPEVPHIFGAGSSTEAGDEGYWILETRHGRVVGGQMRRPGPAGVEAQPRRVGPT